MELDGVVMGWLSGLGMGEWDRVWGSISRNGLEIAMV